MTSFETAQAAAATATAVGTGMTAVGFGSSGIVAGSIAAGVQSVIGNIAAGSSFAALQSFGAVGGFVGLAIAGVLGLGLLLLDFL